MKYRDKETGEVVEAQNVMLGAYVAFGGPAPGARVWFWNDEFRARFEPVKDDDIEF